MTPPLWQKAKNWRASWWRKEESEKAGLKLNIQKTKKMASGPNTSWQIDKQQWQTLFWGALKSLHMMTAVMKLRHACYLEESYDQPREHIKKQRHYFANKGPSSQGYGFPVVMYGCESLARKKKHRKVNAFELWY